MKHPTLHTTQKSNINYQGPKSTSQYQQITIGEYWGHSKTQMLAQTSVKDPGNIGN